MDSTKLPISRRSRVAPFMAMDVLSEAAALERQGRRIIHMEVGEPAAPPPQVVREAAIAALGGGRIGFTEALGLPSLRAAIARSYRELYGIEVPAERIAVTTGSSGAFILVFLACFDPGGSRFPSRATRLPKPAGGARPNRGATGGLGSKRFAVTAEMIEAEHREQGLDGVLLMSPANPSGTVLTRDALAAICATCERLGIRFISDEIYHGLTPTRRSRSRSAP